MYVNSVFSDPFLIFGKIPFVLLLIWIGWSLSKTNSFKHALLLGSAFISGLGAGVAFAPSILGALAGGLGCAGLVYRVLRMRAFPFWNLALGLMGLIALGRLGCLFAGCCFGKHTELPWALHYGAHTPVWNFQHSLNWIGNTQTWTLGTHPYPLYESLGLSIGILLLVLFKPKLQGSSPLWFAATCDLLLRATIDPYRAMINLTWTLIPGPWGLSALQWTLYTAAFFCLCLTWALNRPPTSSPRPQLWAWQSWGCLSFLLALNYWSDSAQTPFLHLLACLCPLLILPTLPLPTWKYGWISRPLAAALGLPQLVLALDLAPIQPIDTNRNWVYGIQSDSALLIRLGNQRDSLNQILERAQKAGLKPQLFLGLGGQGAMGHYQVEQSCGGGYTAYQDTQWTYHLQAEYLKPLSAKENLWFGARTSASQLGRRQQFFQDSTSKSPAKIHDPIYTHNHYRTFESWMELEHLYYSVGLGLNARMSNEVDSLKGEFPILPTAHLRLGFASLGLEGSFGGRSMGLSTPSFLLGLSGYLRDEGALRSISEANSKYFIGAASINEPLYNSPSFSALIQYNRISRQGINGYVQLGLAQIPHVGLGLQVPLF